MKKEEQKEKEKKEATLWGRKKEGERIWIVKDSLEISAREDREEKQKKEDGSLKIDLKSTSKEKEQQDREEKRKKKEVAELKIHFQSKEKEEVVLKKQH